MLNPRPANEILPLAVCPELSENSRLAFQSRIVPQEPPFLPAELNRTLRMRVSSLKICGRSRVQTWNRYAYVANNPLNAVDPLGLEPDCGQNSQCWSQYAQQQNDSHRSGVPGLGGDMDCMIDGAPAPCSMAQNLLTFGSGYVCNNCLHVIGTGQYYGNGTGYMVKLWSVVTQNLSWLGEGSPVMGSVTSTGQWIDLGSGPNSSLSSASSSIYSANSSGGQGLPQVSDPNTHYVVGPGQKITLGQFFNLWGNQIACEVGVGPAKASQHPELYLFSALAMAKGVAGNTFAAVGGTATLGWTAINDAWGARQTCVPAIWGPGHF